MSGGYARAASRLAVRSVRGWDGAPAIRRAKRTACGTAWCGPRHLSTESNDGSSEDLVSSSQERSRQWSNPVEHGDPLYVRQRREWRKQMTNARKAFVEELTANAALHREAKQMKADAEAKVREEKTLLHRIQHDEAWGKLRSARSALSAIRRERAKAERKKRQKYVSEKRTRDNEIRGAEERFRVSRLQAESSDWMITEDEVERGVKNALKAAEPFRAHIAEAPIPHPFNPERAKSPFENNYNLIQSRGTNKGHFFHMSFRKPRVWNKNKKNNTSRNSAKAGRKGGRTKRAVRDSAPAPAETKAKAKTKSPDGKE